MSFFVKDEADMAIARAGFTFTEELSLLMEWARHPDPKIAIRALKNFREIITQVATLNGDIGTVERSRTTEDPQGHEVRETARINTVMSRLKAPERAEGEDHLEHHPPRDESGHPEQGP
jgi:hypothetical protein